MTNDESWIEAVNRALWHYDMGLLDVHGVAETLARKHPEPEITDEAALQEEREALATLLDEVHDDCVTEGGCEFVGWQRGWRPFDRSEPSRHVDAIIASPVWRNRHRVPVSDSVSGEGEQ